MVSVLIVSHAPLANAFIESAKMIMGEDLPPCDSLHLVLGQDMEAFDAMLDEKLSRLDAGDGVLVLADLFAGSPGNAVAYRLNRPNLELIAGVNLAMVLEALSADEDTTLSELKDAVMEAGRVSVVDVGQKMRRE